MRAKVNDVEVELAEGGTVEDVLRERGYPDSGVAVALDGQLVRRSAWASTDVPDGARIEVFTAVQGG
ncbi:sulfur carrier protein [Tamaricihabitans halophyticus]|uniref:Sulfur carrier protein n=1 Tax=Tamaricihabitans halophyticus TaxID=1262583 RepID=A0A4R2R269_9PSEU|nr:sulfur carrier protein ThiS [Tamaricihabitans halophyticus]TCP56613.1 sulfur carrier protein [Tamaricihabitans halophyticus]